jgi:integrase
MTTNGNPAALALRPDDRPSPATGTRQLRSPGEGSIDQLPSGRWRVRLSLPGGERTSFTAATRDEAEELRRAALAELQEADLATVGGITLRQWGPRALDARELAGGRNRSSEDSLWNRHILSADFIDWPLASIRARDVRAWVASTAKKRSGKKQKKHGKKRKKAPKISAGTVKHALDLLRAILHAAVVDELIEHNPAADVEPPAPTPRAEEPWTYLALPEQEAVLTCPQAPPPLVLIVAFALGTGLRQGEQWNLELADLHVDGDDPHVFVRFGSRGKPPKNGKTRKVPLFGLALEAAQLWLRGLRGYAKKNPHKLVFPSPRGCRRGKGKLPKGWRELLAAAGITRPFRWHDLRHTCASSLLAGWWGRRWTLEEVREVLGHKSVTTTERYAHLAPSVLAEAARGTRAGLPSGGFRQGGGEGSGGGGGGLVLGEWSQAGQSVAKGLNLLPFATASGAEGQWFESTVARNPGFGGDFQGFRAAPAPPQPPPRDQFVTSAAVALLEGLATDISKAAALDLARALASAVLAEPAVSLARRLQGALIAQSPTALSIATQLAELVLSPAPAAVLDPTAKGGTR